MLLVIPSIDLLGTYCVRRRESSFIREEQFFDDPVKMARLWRLQNAKTLSVTGHDTGDRCHRKTLSEICAAVDTPVQLRGGLTSMPALDSAFRAGIYRAVIEVAPGYREDLFHKAFEEYGPSRVVAGLTSGVDSGCPDLESIVDLASRLEESGCRRIIFTDATFRNTADASVIQKISALAAVLETARITVTGCISGFHDLMRIDALQNAGVDSTILGRALYENSFPCQQFWCWNWKERVDLSSLSTAQLQKN